MSMTIVQESLEAMVDAMENTMAVKLDMHKPQKAKILSYSTGDFISNEGYFPIFDMHDDVYLFSDIILDSTISKAVAKRLMYWEIGVNSGGLTQVEVKQYEDRLVGDSIPLSMSTYKDIYPFFREVIVEAFLTYAQLVYGDNPINNLTDPIVHDLAVRDFINEKHARRGKAVLDYLRMEKEIEIDSGVAEYIGSILGEDMYDKLGKDGFSGIKRNMTDFDITSIETEKFDPINMYSLFSLLVEQ